MKQFDPQTLTLIKDKVTKDNKSYVYVLTEEGSWDNEHDLDVEVFNDFNKALELFKLKIKNAKTDIKEWNLDDDELNESEQVDPDNEHASFEIYEIHDYDRLHDCIEVRKKEVK